MSETGRSATVACRIRAHTKSITRNLPLAARLMASILQSWCESVFNGHSDRMR